MTMHRFAKSGALLTLLATVACDDSADLVDFDNLSPAEQIELSVLEDQGAWEIAVDVASVSTDAAETSSLSGVAEARTHNAQAQAAFEDARRAWLAGNHREAIDASRVARQLVARALIATGGVPAVEGVIERLNDVLLTLDADVVDDPDALSAELETILAEAESLLEAGDSVGAAAKAILGEQRLRLRRGRHLQGFRVAEQRARLEVRFAHSAVALAERLLADNVVPSTDVLSVTDSSVTDVPVRRNRWLIYARRWLNVAETALSNGKFARAVHAANHAQWAALTAVILPGGVTKEEVRAMVQLAETLHEEAVAAVGDDPTDLEARIMNRAAELIEIGVRRLAAGQRRGVAALWRSATRSHWLLG